MNQEKGTSTLKFIIAISGILAVFLVAIIFFLIKLNTFQSPLSPTVQNDATNPQAVNLWTIFLTGLLTGGLTCLAVQGGLLTATIAQREEERLTEGVKKGAAVPIISFLVTKLLAYTLLGFLLGWLGSLVQLSLTMRIIMQVAVAIFMLGTAGNILNIHPIFRYFIIQPPKFLTRLVRNQSKSKSIFAPALLGAFTVFIPCGTTQAMMALAIAAGNPFIGATILFTFIIGTSPVFFILGYFATKLGDALHQKFMRVAALAIIILAIFNLNNAIALSGSNFTLNNLWQKIFFGGGSISQDTTNNPTINITSSGYSPNSITVKAGSNVKVNLSNTNGAGCIQAFVIPSLNFQKVVPPGTSSSFSFTAPEKPTDIAFMCSMGMYRGIIHVI